MRSLLISPTSQIIADVTARSYREATNALLEEFDIVLLDSELERCYDVLRLVRSGFRKRPGKIIPFGHDELALSKLLEEVRQIYCA